MDRCLLMVVAMLPSETNTLSDFPTLDLLVIYEFIIHSKKKTIDSSIFKKDRLETRSERSIKFAFI